MSPTPGCPVRKLDPDRPSSAPDLATLGLETVDEPGGTRWRVRSFEVARQILRQADGTRQAGFGGDQIHGGMMRPPILYQEGAPHRQQRKASARLFAPKITEGYRPMMETLSDELVGRLRRDRSVDLTSLAMLMAVRVTAQVVGLTNSSLSGMSRRLNIFFVGDPLTVDRSPIGLARTARRATAVTRFLYQDVKPAIRARRRQPQDDVISQLLEQGFTDTEILTECLTYGAAGMVTTREFITMAAWHLLDDPPLLARFRDGDLAARTAILNETLRLEPVVGHLLRRTEQPIEVTGVTIPAGALVDLDLRAVNADPATVGADPDRLCPGRDLPAGVPASVMSFGDGHHRCPGGPIAIMQSEVFLSALLRRDVVAAGPPEVRWNAVSMGYELDRFLIRIRG